MIDMHLHLYPDTLAEKTLKMLAVTAGSGNAIPVYTDATEAGTREKLAQWGMEKAVVLHIATSVRSMHKVNDFASSVQGGSLLCFGSVHPEAPDAVEEVSRIKELGLQGIKLHPVYQSFAADDPKLSRIYEAIEKSGLPLTFHAGFDPAAPDCDFAAPKRILQVVKGYPAIPVIAAHLGGLNQWEEAEKNLLGLPSVYLDTAMLASNWTASKETLTALLRAHGCTKILFGSDCPFSSPLKEAALLRDAGLTPQELSDILHNNACRLLHIQ